MIRSIAAGVALAAAAASVAAAQTLGTALLTVERIPLEDGSFATADRGVLFAPSDRSSADPGVFAVEFYRFRALPGAPEGVPPIFHLNGGPGWSGLGNQFDDRDFYDRQVRRFTEITDFVMVGQRGIGSSKPNTACEPLERLPIDRASDPEAGRAAIYEASRRCRAFWEAEGVDLSGLTVIEAAADVADIAAFLGYRQIQISGGSFGSHWGMAVMRFHPEIVERALLHGMEGPDHTYDMPSWILAALERTAADAESSEDLASRIPDGGLISAFETVLARVEEEPVIVRLKRPHSRDSIDIVMDAARVRDLARGYSGSGGSRHRMAAWPADIVRLYQGDFRQAAGRLNMQQGGPGGFPTAAFFMLDCGSGISPERESILDADAANDVVGRLGFFYQSACPAWDSDLGEDFRENFDTRIPTVMVHGNWDLSTPLENALELAPRFSNGKLIIVERGTHGALGEALRSDDAFRDALMRWFATGDVSGLPDGVELPPVDWVKPPEPGS